MLFEKIVLGFAVLLYICLLFITLKPIAAPKQAFILYKIPLTKGHIIWNPPVVVPANEDRDREIEVYSDGTWKETAGRE